MTLRTRSIRRTRHHGEELCKIPTILGLHQHVDGNKFICSNESQSSGFQKTNAVKSSTKPTHMVAMDCSLHGKTIHISMWKGGGGDPFFYFFIYFSVTSLAPDLKFAYLNIQSKTKWVFYNLYRGRQTELVTLNRTFCVVPTAKSQKRQIGVVQMQSHQPSTIHTLNSVISTPILSLLLSYPKTLGNHQRIQTTLSHTSHCQHCSYHQYCTTNFVLFHNITCYNNSLSSCIHLNTA